MFTILLRCESRILWSSSLLSVSIFPPCLASLSTRKMMRLDFNLKNLDDFFLSILLDLLLHLENSVAICDYPTGEWVERLWFVLGVGGGERVHHCKDQQAGYIQVDHHWRHCDDKQTSRPDGHIQVDFVTMRYEDVNMVIWLYDCMMMHEDIQTSR